MTDKFDVVVIGGGPGGYVAAIRAAQLGKKVAIVEKRKGLGGTCLNVGCIPSKALLDSSEHFYQAKHKFQIHGVEFDNLKLNFKQMMKRKTDVVSSTVKGVDYLMKKNKITRFQGWGKLADEHTVVIENDNSQKITAQNIIIATGSEPTPLPFAPFDDKRIISSTEALELQEVPESIVLIGGGIIGVEMGSVYARLGTKVTVVEFLDSLIPTMDKELGKTLERSLKSLDFAFHFNTKVTDIATDKQGVKVTAENSKQEQLEWQADYALVAIGRRAFTQNLNLEAVGIETDKHGKIPVNEHLQTKHKHIYAIGDVIAGAMLAHKAEEEGILVAEKLAGRKGHINYNAIPAVVYTWPEVASVGKTEEQLKEEKVDYKKGSFPFKASGRARAAEESEGFIKVLADSKTDEILGVHMIGPRCSDIIAEAVVALEFKASAEDIGMISHAHPTFTEPFKEAALMATENRALHI